MIIKSLLKDSQPNVLPDGPVDSPPIAVDEKLGIFIIGPASTTGKANDVTTIVSLSIHAPFVATNTCCCSYRRRNRSN